MTPVNVSVQKTTRRTLELTREQVDNIVRRWAHSEHGFSLGAEIESHVAYDGEIEGYVIADVSTEFSDGDDTEVSDQ